MRRFILLVIFGGLSTASPPPHVFPVCPPSLNLCLNEGCENMTNYVELTDLTSTAFSRILYDSNASYVSKQLNYNTSDCVGHFFVEPEKYKDDNFTIFPDGTIAMGENDLTLNPGSFCIHVTNENDSLNLQLALCFRGQEYEEDPAYLMFYSVMIALSASFLALVFIIYAILPPLQDLFGKCIMCFTANLFTGFMCLVILQQQPYGFTTTWCIVIAFVTYATLLASFTWLNVISIHLFLTTRVSSKPTSTWKRFFFYNLYVWTLVGAFLIAAILTDHILPNSSSLRPGFGKFTCWFQGKLESTTYFNGPVAVLTCINTILYILTAIQITKHRSREEKRTNFYLYLSLFIIMGVTWLAEAITGIIAVDTKYTIMFDIINALQGLLVFIVLICRRNVFKLLRQKCTGSVPDVRQDYLDMTTLE